jgi:hypothetical protein
MGSHVPHAQFPTRGSRSRRCFLTRTSVDPLLPVWPKNYLASILVCDHELSDVLDALIDLLPNRPVHLLLRVDFVVACLSARPHPNGQMNVVRHARIRTKSAEKIKDTMANWVLRQIDFLPGPERRRPIPERHIVTEPASNPSSRQRLFQRATSRNAVTPQSRVQGPLARVLWGRGHDPISANLGFESTLSFFSRSDRAFPDAAGRSHTLSESPTIRPAPGMHIPGSPIRATLT